jgi:hypothetical protein
MVFVASQLGMRQEVREKTMSARSSKAICLPLDNFSEDLLIIKLGMLV